MWFEAHSIGSSHSGCGCFGQRLSFLLLHHNQMLNQLHVHCTISIPIYTLIGCKEAQHFYSIIVRNRAAKINKLIIPTYCIKTLIFYHTKIMRHPKTIIIIVIITIIRILKNDCYINLLILHHHYTRIIIIIYTSIKENSLKFVGISEAITFLQQEIIQEVGLRCSVRMRSVLL